MKEKRCTLKNKNNCVRCAQAAKNRGFDVIAIQEGKCFSSKTAPSVYHLFGQTEECESDIEKVLQVYQLESIIERE